MVIPVDAPVELAAFSADDHLGEAVVTGVDALLAVRPSVNLPASNKLRLHLHEEVFWNDRFVIAFDVVLRDGAVVLDPFLCQKVGGVGLL